MLFEPYTRNGMLHRLDADFSAMCGPTTDFPFTRLRDRIGLFGVLALGGWMLLIPASLATAQSAGTTSTATAGPSTKTSTAKPPAHHHHHAKPVAATVAPAPVAPPPPLPPAEQPPNPATINFNNGVLSVHAQNSSLVNILVQIQHLTGLVIDGLSHDQRVYGQYGPGTVSATLSALLDGSGYDFVIVGGGGGHAAARLILSAPGSAGAPATAAAAAAAPDVVSNPEPPPSDENPNGNGDEAEPADPTTPPQPKSPDEIFNELRRAHPQ
jgi:hypothetical protein